MTATEQRETPWQREQRIERELSAERREWAKARREAPAALRVEQVRMDGGGLVTLERRTTARDDEYVRVVEVAA